jgi:hypothetical protein
MVDQNSIEDFILNFLKSLKCEINQQGNIFEVSHLPKSFQDLFGKNEPYRLCFLSQEEGAEYVIRGSRFFNSVKK